MLLTYVGVPSILYGDEVGLEGHDGLSTRRTMPWDRGAWDLEQLAFVRDAGPPSRRARARSRVGGFQVLEIGDDSLAFLRDTDEEQVDRRRRPRSRRPRPATRCRSPHGAVADGTTFVELFSGARATVARAAICRSASTAPGVAIWRPDSAEP